MLPDLFGGDLEKHIAQDKVVLASLKRLGFPVDIIGPIQEFLLQAIAVEVQLTAEKDDPDVPLKSTVTEILGALRDETFQQVVYRCYWMKSFRDIRNHRTLPSAFTVFSLMTLDFSHPSCGESALYVSQSLFDPFAIIESVLIVLEPIVGKN